MERKIVVFSALFGVLFLITWYLPVNRILSQFLPRWLWLLPLSFFLTYVVTELLLRVLGDPKLPVNGKAVLITGCDSGFGYKLAQELDLKGFQVFAGCLFPEGDGAKSLQNSSNINVFKMDITKDNEVSQALTFVKNKLGEKKLWGVVANAGIQIHGWFEWNDLNAIQRLFDVNVFGVVRTVQTFAPLIRESKGRIVITTSLAGRCTFQGLVPYSMSKAAVISLTDGIRRELHPFGVHASSIEPNMYKTSIPPKDTKELHFTWKNLKDELRESYGEKLLRKAENMVHSFYALCQSDLSCPMQAFEHALMAVHPKPSYSCDLPSRVAVTKAFTWLPEEFTDLFVRNMDKVMNIATRFSRVK